MIITLKLSPQVPYGDPSPLVVERQGEILFLNAEALDLSFMEPGDSLPSGSIDHPLLGSATIERDESGFLIDGLLFQIDAGQTDPAACFPEPVIISHDGVVALPAQTPPTPLPISEPEPDSASVATPDNELEHEHQD